MGSLGKLNEHILREIKNSFKIYKAFPQQRSCAIPNTTANCCEFLLREVDGSYK